MNKKKNNKKNEVTPTSSLKPCFVTNVKHNLEWVSNQIYYLPEVRRGLGPGVFLLQYFPLVKI